MNRYQGKLYRSAKALNQEAMGLELETAPFKPASIKNLFIKVDSREPGVLSARLQGTKIGHNLTVEALPVGDVWVGNRESGDLLIIERKTVTDFYNSIISSHAHDQAERMSDFQKAQAEQGNRVRVVWIIESEQEGQRGLYDTLPQIKQVDGMVAYLTGVLGQHVLQAYNENHLGYLILKLAQTFHEQELFYKVKSNNGSKSLANRNKKDRSVFIDDHAETGHHGVRRADRSLEELLSHIPNINTAVAHELSKTGKTFSQIAQMSVNELMTIKGVAETSAIKIYETLNKA